MVKISEAKIHMVRPSLAADQAGHLVLRVAGEHQPGVTQQGNAQAAIHSHVETMTNPDPINTCRECAETSSKTAHCSLTVP